MQVHGVGKRKEPLQVRWRNLRIKPLAAKEAFVPLFDGKTLDGWHALPGGKWEVRDGTIVGTSPKSERRHGLLATDKTYGDFTVRLKFRVVKVNTTYEDVGGCHAQTSAH